jgi:hypothetical protein
MYRAPGPKSTLNGMSPCGAHFYCERRRRSAADRSLIAKHPGAVAALTSKGRARLARASNGAMSAAMFLIAIHCRIAAMSSVGVVGQRPQARDSSLP